MWVDCVDVNRQPGMLAPSMAGKTIASPPPPSIVKGRPAPPPGGFAKLDVELHANELDEQGSVRHCDPGTIPIRRTTKADLDRFSTLRDFFSKGPGGGQAPAGGPRPKKVLGSPFLDQRNYEYAAQGQDVANWGVWDTITIDQPFVDRVPEHSISQVWAINNPDDMQSRETAEVGWNVDLLVYGQNDYSSHLFIYWTDDNYGSTGCYNLRCTAFVQTNNSIVLGGAFSPGSLGTYMDVGWVKAGANGDWWLYVNDWPVGYYPASQYTHGMQTQASRVEYGGEVYDSWPNGKHTQTQMGSGAFAEACYPTAAFQSSIQYVDTTYTFQEVNSTRWDVTNSNCYDLISAYSIRGGLVNGECTAPEEGYFEYFGGPGWNPNTCP